MQSTSPWPRLLQTSCIAFSASPHIPQTPKGCPVALREWMEIKGHILSSPGGKEPALEN